MEGACIYINNFNESTLLIYKEYINNEIFLLYYCNYKLYYSFITSKLLTNIIPFDCIHILTKLPFYYNDLEKTIKIWKLLVLNKIKNKNIKNNYKNSKTDFFEKFSKYNLL